MASRKKTTAEGTDLEGLRDLVGQNGDAPVESKAQTRRGLLKMAGAALAGAAGAAALRAVPAAAATGQAVLQGCYNFPGANQPTIIMTTGGTPLSTNGMAFSARSSTGVVGAGYYPTTPASEIGVLGSSKVSGGPGTGVFGKAGTGIGVNGVAASTGVGGLFYSGTGYDAELGFATTSGPVGSGRLAQVGRGDVGGAAPSWAPAFAVQTVNTNWFQHELVRGNFDGSIWASRYATAGTSRSRWKRMNTPRVDTADGLGGNFKPVRRIDTRSAGGPFGNSAVPHNYSIAGFGAGASNIPTDAVAVFGTITAVGATGGGWLQVAPTGVVVNQSADPSSINFQVGFGAIATSFFSGLGGGSLSVWVSVIGSGKVNFIVDITGYVQ